MAASQAYEATTMTPPAPVHAKGTGSGQTSPLWAPKHGAVVVAGGEVVVAVGAETWPRASLRR